MRVKSLLFIIAMLGVFCTHAGNSFSIKTIVIDAGHGGKDPGATGPGKTNEKDVALAVSLKLGEEIHKNFPDINIIYTRKTDVFVELHERADIANKNKADLFICIHCNSSPVSSTYGTSTYVLGLHRTEANLEVAKRENSVINLEGDRDKNYEFDPNSPEGNIIMSMKQNAFLDQSIDFASKIEAQFENTAKRKSLGVKQAGFYVLYKTAMPSLLSEIGFVSNPEEEKFLKSAKGQETIANSLLKAFSDYKFEMENGQGEHTTDLAAGNSKNETIPADATKSDKQTGTVRAPLPITTGGAEVTGGQVPTETNPAGDMTTEEGKKIRKPFDNSSGGGNSEGNAADKTEAPTKVNDAPNNNAVTTISQPPAVVEKTPEPEAPKEEVVVKTEPEKEPEVKEPVKETPIVIKEEPKNIPVIEKPAPVTHPAPTPKTETTVTKTEIKTTPAPRPKEPETVIKPAPVKPTPVPKAPAVENIIIYKVQLFALKVPPKKTETDKTDHLFGTLTTESLPNGIVRYYAGEAKSIEAIHSTLSKAQSNGYRDAFVVGFKNGLRFLPDKPMP